MRVNKKRVFSKAFDGESRPQLISDDDSDEKEAGQCGLRNISEQVLQVLLEKHSTTYKQVSDFITSTEAHRIELEDKTEKQISYGRGIAGMDDVEQNLKKDETNRKRIKNLRRRVYDSLNVFLACDIFKKDGKKVTFNMEFYQCLPKHC